MRMAYFIVTGDNGTSRMIYIGQCETESDAATDFRKRFNAEPSYVHPGLEVDPHYVDLLTDVAKKTILKLKSKSNDAPEAFAYANMTQLTH